MTSRRSIALILFWCAFALCVPYVALAVFFSDQHRDDRLETFYERAPEIQALTLGSSHTRALHYPSMGLSGYSFADDGGDLMIADYKLRRLVDHLPNLEYVFLVVAPGLLSYNRILGEPGEFPSEFLLYSPRAKSYSRLTAQDIVMELRAQILSIRTAALNANQSSRKAFQALFRNRGFEPANDETVCMFHGNPPDFPHEDGIHRGFARKPLVTSCMTPEFDDKDVSWRMSGIRDVLEKEPRMRDINLGYLQSMAELLREREAELVLVITPTTRGYFEDPRMKDIWAIERPILEGLATADNVQIIDIHDHFFDTNYQEDNKWFSDPDHVSYDGAVSFSKAVAAELFSQ